MTDAETRSLAGHWRVDRLRSPHESLGPPLEGSAIAVIFDGAGNVMGNAGCNSYRGSCRVDVDRITFDTLATTRRMCLRPPGVMEQESRFLGFLTGTVGYSFGVEGTLILLDRTGTPLVEMSRRDEEATDVDG